VHTRHSGNIFLSKPKYGKGRKRLTEDEAFVVRHFAGEVLYETHRFLDKNNDTIHDELIDVLAESSLPFVQGVVVVEVRNISVAFT
jgi:myosin heavy subunit